MDAFFPIDFELGVKNEAQIARFKSNEFGARFSSIARELLNHNGIEGSGYDRWSQIPPGRYLMVFQPTGAIYFQSRINAVIHEAALLSPQRTPLVTWQYHTNLGNLVFHDSQWESYEKTIAFLVLSGLRTLESVGVVKLKFSPPQTMGGATNPGFGHLR